LKPIDTIDSIDATKSIKKTSIMIHMLNQNHHKKIEVLKQATSNHAPASSSNTHQNHNNRKHSTFPNNHNTSADAVKVNYYRGTIPDTSDPMDWFSFADKDNDGFMSQEEAIASINVQLCPKSNDERLFIRKSVQSVWGKYDTDYDTYISLDEFIKNNMIQFVIDLEKKWKHKFIEKSVPERSHSTSSSNDSQKKVEKKDSAINVHPLSGSLPDLSTMSMEWYEQVDIEKHGMLSQDQIIRGLHLTLKPSCSEEEATIRENVKHYWQIFDVDHNGLIDKWEFLTKGGMADALIQMEKEWKQCSTTGKTRTCETISKVFSKATRRHSYEPPPYLKDNPEAWFDHFDIDRSHYLSQKEVIHGLYVTLNASTSEKRQVIREHVITNWDKYDMDNNGVIDKVEFLKTNGLSRCITRLLRLWPQSDSCLMDKGAVEVTVCIPKGKGSGDIIKMSSPRTQEFILIMIPVKKKWNKSDDGSCSFTVLF